MHACRYGRGKQNNTNAHEKNHNNNRPIRLSLRDLRRARLSVLMPPDTSSKASSTSAISHPPSANREKEKDKDKDKGKDKNKDQG